MLILALILLPVVVLTHDADISTLRKEQKNVLR